MKIQGSHPLYRLTPNNGTKTDQRTEEKSSIQRESVQLSGEAQWMQELKTAIDDIPEVRVDEVERARKDIASGELGSKEDFENAVNALMHEI
jgi:anti-sigma28 factor (negative regulator of flagellin synthesis)